MTIVINELKKIFNFKSIIFLIIITIVMYKLYIIPSDSLKSGTDFINNIHIQMVKKYGNSMDKDEYKDFLDTYKKKVKIADEYINNNDKFRNLGIYNYEEYNKIARNNGEEKYQNEKLRDLYYEYLYSEDTTTFRELDEMENIKITYEANVLEPFAPIYSDNKKAIDRHIEIKKNEEIQSLLPYTVFETYEVQFKSLSILIFISIIFLISPIYLGDRLNNVDYLQYSSKKGRKIFKGKILASMLSSIIVVSINLLIFFKFYLNEFTKIFLDCGISGYYNSPIRSWYHLTLFEYILISAILVYILSIVISLLSFYISSKVNNYISLVGIQVPILVMINLFLLKYILNNATSMYIQVSGFNYITTWKYYIHMIYG
ncbi:hypothetical protein, partial [Terrisporobacter sp.]|uniref:hypothetical protein n=1 Tax=Terrisporobacter sp. TaxID=1965305 RepID=UPI002626BB12